MTLVNLLALESTKPKLFESRHCFKLFSIIKPSSRIIFRADAIYRKNFFPSFSEYKICTVCLILKKARLFQNLTLKFHLGGSFIKTVHSQNRILYGV